MIGTVHRKDNECVLLFNTKDAVLYMDEDLFKETELEEQLSDCKVSKEKKRKVKKVTAYPAYWADSFGESYYMSRVQFENLEPEGEAWQADSRGIPFIQADRNVTTPTAAAANIKQILGEIGVRDE